MWSDGPRVRLRRFGGVRPPVPIELKMCRDRESSSDVKYSTQSISTIESMSQPADIALREASFAKMPSLTPITAKTTAIAPNVDIWKRCIEIESLASVCRTPIIRKSCRKIENHRTPTAPCPTAESMIWEKKAVSHPAFTRGNLLSVSEKTVIERAHYGQYCSKEKQVVGENWREIISFVAARWHVEQELGR
ncbi:hypothetical protein BD410DRAFT_800225 [Rickenella mellea]|uniref:Uncharacterized protein n=1 Tax=Rickenella mellea TaxID=50990 RepID=A0A4Y7QFA5_9AGAM|nr:hypothetical protein BD410DRAFT_800225 [Rickenella mellea]